MELKHFLWWFIMLVLFSLCINGCFGCLEEERIALLQLKASINYPNGSSLSYWDDSTNKLNDCCQWKSLECNNTTRRVIRLDLRYVRDYSTLGDWYLNASLFLPFRELNYLDLSNNGISGWVPNEGFNRFSRLNKLEVLVLDVNRFNDSFLSSISAVASLKKLYLTHNQLDQQISLPELGRLNNLKELYLDGSYIEKSFLQRAGNITSLDVLTMAGCRLNGSLPTQGWCDLRKLKELDLSRNELEGILPSCLANMTELQFLDLSSNHFSGGLMLSPLSSLQSLKFPTWLLKNNSRLEILNLRKNSFIGPLHVPYQPNPTIWSIDISENHLRGPIPANIGLVFPNLGYLNMSENAFEGTIPSSFGDLVSLKTLDLSGNHLSGTMPKQFAMSCSSLEYVRLSNNNFSGQIFPTGFNLTNLSYLYIENNRFSGKIPNSLAKIQHGTAFDFSNNYLSGELPRWMGNMSSLKEIAMAGNQLEGPIPPPTTTIQGHTAI